MLHCPTRKTHQSSPPADGNSRLPWNGSSTAQWNEKMLGVQESKGLTMPQTYHFDSRCIVWFHHCVRHLWRRDHGEGFHNASIVRSSWKCLQGMFGIWIWWREQKRIERTFAKHTASEMRSGYSSRTLEISNVPIPAPVPPPREWQSWKPCRPHLLSCQTRKSDDFLYIYSILQYVLQNTGEETKLETTVWQNGSHNFTIQDKHQSHPSASFRTTSSTESINSAPSV